MNPFDELHAKSLRLFSRPIWVCGTENAYIIHGRVEVDAPWRNRDELAAWLAGEGKIYEGIVVHDAETNTLSKCHRGHLGGSTPWKGAVPLPMRPTVTEAPSAEEAPA